MWLPTAINAFIAAEILWLSWERYAGMGNTAQGEIGPFMHIIGISAPIAAVILVGCLVFAALRARLRQNAQETQSHRGVIVLVFLNIAAPVLLLFGLSWLA